MTIRISTGPVRAAGYADKLRRVLIAATKSRGVKVDDAVRVAAHINQHLFKILRENNVEKGDIVRIMFNVDILDGRITVDWGSIKIEVYKPMETYGAEKITSEVPKEVPEVTEEEVKAAVEESERPEEEELIEEVKPAPKKGIFSRIIEKIKSIFGGK